MGSGYNVNTPQDTVLIVKPA